MRVVVQRSLDSKVLVDGKITGSIEKGLVILVGFTHNDDIDDINYIVKKIINLRIFDDDKGVMNLSIKDTLGEILSISQFTLYADPTHGNRPSFTLAKKPEEASLLYDAFNDALKELCLDVKTGIFGADMQISLVNDGPVTIIYDEENGE